MGYKKSIWDTENRYEMQSFQHSRRAGILEGYKRLGIYLG